MGRQPCCDKVGLKKGPWTAEEDKKLINFILTNGHCCWRAVPKLAGLLRCGKSCRLRWTNYLRPDLKRGLLSEHEEQMVIDLHAKLGNRWSKIASHLPGRTDNEIKNLWNTHIKKKLKKMGIDPQTHKPICKQPEPQLQSSLPNIGNEKNFLEADQPQAKKPVETPGSSTLTADHDHSKPEKTAEKNILEAFDGFSVDEVPLIDPDEILAPSPLQHPPPNPTYCPTITSSSCSSSSSLCTSGSSLILEDLEIPSFDWSYNDECGSILMNNYTNNNSNGTGIAGLLWEEDGELSDWNLAITGDYVDIDPFHQIINQ